MTKEQLGDALYDSYKDKGNKIERLYATAYILNNAKDLITHHKMTGEKLAQRAFDLWTSKEETNTNLLAEGSNAAGGSMVCNGGVCFGYFAMFTDPKLKPIFVKVTPSKPNPNPVKPPPKSGNKVVVKPPAKKLTDEKFSLEYCK